MKRSLNDLVLRYQRTMQLGLLDITFREYAIDPDRYDREIDEWLAAWNGTDVYVWDQRLTLN